MYTKKFLAGLYGTLYRIRHFETRCIRLYRQGLIRGYFHPYLGEEAIAAGVCAALGEKDYITSTHRGHGHCIARGAGIKRMVAELLGKKTGYCKGLGGSMHIADFSAGNLGANGIVGAGIPLGAGAALGISMRREKNVSVVFTSDGAVNNGVFSEALNLAAAWSLPLLLVVENNQYAVSTPISQATRETDLYKRGIGLGVESFAVDGNDVLEVYGKAKESVEKCRNGGGPVLMEAVTFRHGGHHVNDPGLYLSQEQLDYYKSKDPVGLGRKYLLELGKAAEKEVKAIESRVEREMDEAIAFAKDSPEMSVVEFLQMVEAY
ncbi:MAG: thiamine pyrophosphate-dependent dehydrogenase E1 component subunit alpha [Candidatus Glassbacteria bacterium]|nr:thiamine pyrophosphate-dependent dehydrogenase E1 component subunit alpha [Candidatus Glassbacteria bacterium]